MAREFCLDDPVAGPGHCLLDGVTLLDTQRTRLTEKCVLWLGENEYVGRDRCTRLDTGKNILTS